MESEEQSLILGEVESLLKRLQTLPSGLKLVALNRIKNELQEENADKDEDGVEKTSKTTMKKRKKKKIVEYDDEELSDSCLSDEIDRDAGVETTYSSRGRRIRRINLKYLSYIELVLKRERKRKREAGELFPLHIGDNCNDCKNGECSIDFGNSEFTNRLQKYKKLPERYSKFRKVYIKQEVEPLPKNETENDNDANENDDFDQLEASQCPYCSFKYTIKSQYAHHLKKHTRYKCKECGKLLAHTSNLWVHLKRHSGQREFSCGYCDYKAFTKVERDRHMTVHTGEKNELCKFCGKTFSKLSTLRDHVRTIHLKSKKYNCQKCDFVTFRSNNLRVHERMKHEGIFDNHICPVCGAQVKQRRAFVEHIKSHSGEKPFRCDQCDKLFACVANLNVHVKSIHEPRQHYCCYCEKKFQTKYHLARHQVIHTKQKPFACPLCSYQCNTQGNLTKHVRTIHRKLDFSYKRHKSEQQVMPEISSEWITKGMEVTEVYLKELSDKLGRDVTLDELREKEVEKQQKALEKAHLAVSKRSMRTSQIPEHSYHSMVCDTAALEEDDLQGDVDVDNSLILSANSKIYQLITDSGIHLCMIDEDCTPHLITTNGPGDTTLLDGEDGASDIILTDAFNPIFVTDQL